ncbi:MAG: DUF2141 domain-containing protein [Chitinophagaceae bacterium]
MKKQNILFALIVCTLLGVACKKNTADNNPNPNPNPNPTATDSLAVLRIDLSGLKNTNGVVNVALYNSAASFNKPAQAYKQAIVTPSATSFTIVFDSITPGTYAFGLFHDENNDATLNTNILTIPTEGFAFSNNAMGTFGAPTFAQAQFTLAKKDTLTQTITLKFLP